MRACLRCLAVSLVLSALCSVNAQELRGVITGRVTDASQGVLPGARIQVQPISKEATSDSNGEFSIQGLAPGKFTLTVSNPGFALYSRDITLASDPVKLDVALQVGTHNEVVDVTGERQGGEVEALEIERTAENIVQVLPADVIQSLPNTNIADA